MLSMPPDARMWDTEVMAQVVELFGAPGTGKSSLARALDGRRASGRRLVTADRLTRVPGSGPIGRVRGRALTPTERRAALAERREDWADLLALCARAPLALADDPLRALQAPGWLATTLELRALAASAQDDVIVVLDEGLVQRAPVVCGPRPDDAALDRYVRSLPTRTLHVHLREDPGTLLVRLRDRDRVIDRHVGLDDAALERSVADDVELLDRCATLLRSAGHRIISVSTGGHPEQHAREVSDALETLD